MLKLSENKTALINLDSTIRALENLDFLINTYKEDKPGPDYCIFDYQPSEQANVQFDRQIILVALNSQRNNLVEYLKTFNIDAEA